MNKFRTFALQHQNQIMLGLALMVPAAAGTASAQTTSAAREQGAAAVTGLGLSDMIGAFGGAIQQLVKENGTALALVILPILAWYFIRNQLRGSI